MQRQLQTLRGEIDRDQRMVALGLLRQLASLSTEQLTLAIASGRIDPPGDLWGRIEALLATSRLRYRQLNDARINRRGRFKPSDPPHPRPPRGLAAFARNGAYAGPYSDFRELVRALLGERLTAQPQDLQQHLDLDGIGLDLHLRGLLWTLTHAGQLHAFHPHPDLPPPATKPPTTPTKPRRAKRPR